MKGPCTFCLFALPHIRRCAGAVGWPKRGLISPPRGWRWIISSPWEREVRGIGNFPLSAAAPKSFSFSVCVFLCYVNSPHPRFGFGRFM